MNTSWEVLCPFHTSHSTEWNKVPERPCDLSKNVRSIKGKTCLASGCKDGDESTPSLHPSQLHRQSVLRGSAHSPSCYFMHLFKCKKITWPPNRPHLDSAFSSSHKRLSIPYSVAGSTLGSRAFHLGFAGNQEQICSSRLSLESLKEFPGNPMFLQHWRPM